MGGAGRGAVSKRGAGSGGSHTWLHLVVFAISAGAFSAGPSPAQPLPPSSPPPESTVEVWGALHVTFGHGSGQLESSYVPEVVSAPDAEGSARQVLALDPATERGVEIGVNLFPARSLGIQGFVSYAGADLGGVNSPYELQLRYVSRPPPDYQPMPVELSESVAWPDTTGRLRQLTLGVGPAVRWRRPPVTIVASGGLAWIRLSGEAEPLAFTTFRLGGHSTLFSDDFRVRAALGPTSILGGYLGGVLAVDVSRHVAVATGLRVLVAGDADVSARVDAIVDTSGGVTGLEPRDVDLIMAPGPARLSPQRVAVTAGVTIR